MRRSGPDDGYDFGNKAQYRRTIWRRLRDACKVSRSDAQLLLMPSAERREVEVVLSHGFREENLHLVDDNQAIAAHLSRRYPKANIYGVKVDEACRRIAKLGIHLDLVNLDLCGHVCSGKTVETLRGVTGSGAVGLHTKIAVTMLRGRETGFSQWTRIDSRFLILFKDLRLRHADQVRCALAGIWLTVGNWKDLGIRNRVTIPLSDRDAAFYKSTAGTQTMLWCIYRFSDGLAPQPENGAGA